MQGRTVLLNVVELNLAAGHRITRILQVLKIPRSTYYDSLNWQPSKTESRRKLLKEKVLEYWLKFPMYGYPRLSILLNKKFQFGVGTGLIYKLMCELGIQSRMIKKWKKPKTHTTVEQRSNLIKTLSDKSTVLLTDITYIRVNQKWVYLASLYNPETRRVMSHKIGEHMTKELATSVIDPKILKKLGITIIHSDMGSQYTSDLFERTLSKHKIKHSYSKKGCPGDNARIESFHSILKREYVNFQRFKTIHEAIAGIDSYIRWYNHDSISLIA